jgi:ParB family chromosome partitioning protein
VEHEAHRVVDGLPLGERLVAALVGNHLAAAGKANRPSPVPKSLREPSVVIPGVGAATVTTGRRGRQLKLDLKADDTDFVSWLEGKAPQLIAELHERWKRKED